MYFLIASKKVKHNNCCLCIGALRYSGELMETPARKSAESYSTKFLTDSKGTIWLHEMDDGRKQALCKPATTMQDKEI
jgi:hypothetical protein